MYLISQTIKSQFIVKMSKWIAMICHPINGKLRREYREKLEWRRKDFNCEMPFESAKIPIYIISFNRLSYLKQMIEWLEKYDFQNINVIDNNSNYKPLLEYLKGLKYNVYYMEKNYGHGVFWSSGKFDDVIRSSFYIVSDPDIAANENLKPDFIKDFYRLLGEYPGVVKVGFALDKDDLPDTETNVIVKKWEQQFWERKLKDDLEIYGANIDTTFALYRPGNLRANTPIFYRAIRVAGNFTAKHLPWYITENFTEEEQNYFDCSDSRSATWLKDVEYYRKVVK